MATRKKRSSVKRAGRVRTKTTHEARYLAIAEILGKATSSQLKKLRLQLISPNPGVGDTPLSAFEAGYLVAELSFTIGDRGPRPRKKIGGILFGHHDPCLSMCPPVLAKLKRQKP